MADIDNISPELLCIWADCLEQNDYKIYTKGMRGKRKGELSLTNEVYLTVHRWANHFRVQPIIHVKHLPAAKLLEAQAANLRTVRNPIIGPGFYSFGGPKIDGEPLLHGDLHKDTELMENIVERYTTRVDPWLRSLTTVQTLLDECSSHLNTEIDRFLYATALSSYYKEWPTLSQLIEEHNDFIEANRKLTVLGPKLDLWVEYLINLLNSQLDEGNCGHPNTGNFR